VAENKREPKQVTLSQFLTGTQIAEALAIWRRSMTPAKEIAEKVMTPNMAAINLKLGQENDPLFLAYMVEAVFNQTVER